MKINKSSGLPAQAGQVSKLLLVLAIIVLVAVVITFLIMKMATPPPKPPTTTEPAVPLPVYEQTLGNIRFVFQSARDRGNTLWASETKNPGSWQKDLTTGERFIMVTIGAQNKGKENIAERSWDIENIIDSEGRNFVPSEGYIVAQWLPEPDLCSALLKPEFDPTPCIKIYEVSKKSTGLKIRVITGIDNSPSNFSSKKLDEALIDLIVK